MTGDEIIALARANFGEETALTVSAAVAEDFVDLALDDLYNDLPAERMRNLISEDTVATTSGKGDIPDTWDRILDVYVDDVPARLVERDVIQNADYSTLFTPPIPIFHIDESHVWIRPTTGTVKITHMDGPGVIGNFSSEVTNFAEVWHPALVLLTTAYMYAQEEDLTQAQHYRSLYNENVSSLTEQLAAEAAA